ncbi:hypothetical protein ATANTOWER_022248, partial [Ataeniobius toweri]|nr:hypothetical protein [Ataeniobius toweri]
ILHTSFGLHGNKEATKRPSQGMRKNTHPAARISQMPLQTSPGIKVIAVAGMPSLFDRGPRADFSCAR